MSNCHDRADSSEFFRTLKEELSVRLLAGVGVRPEDDVIVLGARPEVRLPHSIDVDQGHAPDRRLDSASLQCPLRQFGRREGRY